MARAATTKLKVNAALGTLPTLEWRPISELLVDSSYQRDIDGGASQALIRRIAMFWDWSLCQPLAVSRRPDGTLLIVDGQHRASAAKLRGCYGNNMQAAERIVAGPELEEALWTELLALQFAHPGGFMVRLHVLGDFYSLAYVKLWRRALAAFPALHVFGFTARLPGTELGDALWALTEADWGRFAIRFSGLDSHEKASVIQGDRGLNLSDSVKPIQCPAQTDATDCCATCGLCWHSDRSIAFARH